MRSPGRLKGKEGGGPSLAQGGGAYLFPVPVGPSKQGCNHRPNLISPTHPAAVRGALRLEQSIIACGATIFEWH